MFKKFDKLFVSVGIILNAVTTQIPLYQCSDPWLVFQIGTWQNFLRLIVNYEVVKYPTSANNILRETILNLPGVGPGTTRSVVETQLITNANTGNIVQNSIRERDRFVIALTPLIWIPSFFYAFSEEFRPQMTTLLITTGYVPEFTVELFKRTRKSRTDAFWIIPSIIFSTGRVLSATFPVLKDTLWDPDFLSSQTGMRTWINFLGTIRNSEGNYIPFTNATTQVLPPLESGEYITFGAFSTDKFHDFRISPVYILEHSLPTHHAVYATDAICSTVFYSDDALGTIPYNGHKAIQKRGETQSSLQQWAIYMVDRVTLTLPNDRSNRQQLPSTNDSQTRSDDKFNRTQRRPSRRPPSSPPVGHSNPTPSQSPGDNQQRHFDDNISKIENYHPLSSPTSTMRRQYSLDALGDQVQILIDLFNQLKTSQNTIDLMPRTA